MEHESYGMSVAESGNGLCEGYQDTRERARRAAQACANRLGEAVELYSGDDYSEIFEPEDDDAESEVV